MSKGRFDRNRAVRQQAWQSDYAQFTGGLDQASSALQIKAGRLAYCRNWEEVFGKRGYTMIRGYERFDGHLARPSQATYRVLAFTGGNAGGPTVVGDVVTNAAGTVTAKWIMSSITSGSTAGGDAAGFMVLFDLAGGDFAAAGEIRNAGVQCATAAAATTQASIGYGFHQAALTATREYVRGLIAHPTGSGPVLGGAVFNDTVYVARNVAGDATATLWRSSASGWVAVRTGLHPSTSYRFKEANFTGDPTNLNLYMVNGRDRLASISKANVFTKAAPIFGSEATSTSSVSIGTGAKTFTVVQAARDYVAGSAITIWRDTDASQFMTGLVTAYNTGTGQLDVNVTSSSAPAGPFTDWEVGLTDVSDKPYLVTEHKDHLFLAYPNGQLQTSSLGDGMVYTTTATLFGVGQEITAMSSLKGKSLAVFGRRRIDIISGSSQLDWSKDPYTDQSGAVLDSVQDNDGNPIYFDSKGLSTLAATQNFGDFAAAIFGRDAKKTLDAKRAMVVASRMAFGNNQYRLYFTDGSVLRMTLMAGGGPQAMSPSNVSPTLSQYDAIPSTVFQGLIDGEERMFFGTADGKVMEEDVGTSFDGEAIDYVLRLPFNHLKAPGIEKLFHKLEMEMAGGTALTINFRQVFDYDDSTFATGGDSIPFLGTGSLFDVGAFNDMVFDRGEMYRAEADIDGQGRNIALLIWASSDFSEPVTLQGLLLYFTLLGVRP